MLDAGALIGLDRGLASVRGYILLADRDKAVLSTSSAAVAQVWRGGGRQARLARFLGSDLVSEVALDRDAVVLTSDPEDIARWGVPDGRIVRC